MEKVVENKVNEVKPEVKPEKSVIKPIELVRYDEIEKKVDRFIQDGDIDSVLLMNELTLARNLEDELSSKDAKQFGVVFVAFKGTDGVIKRAGVYNTTEIKDSEVAEDILISEDFHDKRVLAVPRNSVFANKHFNK